MIHNAVTVIAFCHFLRSWLLCHPPFLQQAIQWNDSKSVKSSFSSLEPWLWWPDFILLGPSPSLSTICASSLYMRFCLPLTCIHIGNGIWRSSISRWRHSLQEAIWYFHQFRFNMCAAANLGYGLHVKSIDRNHILVKNYISLINVIYIQLKNISQVCLLPGW